jgi:hypothetical protein
MARNRKSESAAVRFGPLLKALLLCLLIGGSGVGYVWQKEQIVRLGEQRRKRELRLRELERQNEKLARQLATMRMPLYLDIRIKELNLGLVRPQQGQVWTLPEPARETPRPQGEQQYAARSQAAEAMP